MKLDTCLWIDKIDMDRVYIEKELRALGIYDFAKAAENLSNKLFSGQQILAEDLSAEEADLFLYITGSGTYGNKGNLFQNLIEKIDNGKGSVEDFKKRYFLYRLFPDREFLYTYFPYSKSHAWALPIAWGIRMYLYFKRKKQNLRSELAVLKSYNRKSREQDGKQNI